jgi:FHA domain-containing protein
MSAEMVLLIRATSFKGQPLGQELSAQFAEDGGTIGRGESNALVLPDPERYISRTHAAVSFQAGGFVLTDTGTKNPVVLSGRPLGPGRQARLSDGDTIKIGDYLLAVSLAASGVSPTPVPVAVVRDDRVAAPELRSADPFADLVPPEHARSTQPAPTPMWPEPPRPREPAPLAGDPLASVRPAEPHIDEILGLRPAAADPLAPEPPLLGQATPVLPDDPFEDWPAIARARRSPTVPDDAPELNVPFLPPEPRRVPASRSAVDAPIGAAAERLPPVSSPPRGAPGPDELLRAFARGAGIPEGKLPGGMTPEMMETLGGIVHEALKGTIELLRARATTKAEMRADVTMIMPMDNNPLKFSPSAEAALVHLLAPAATGFASPLRAMRDAYDDLRAHQLGFLAGTRAALDEVLARFEPGGLEGRLSEPGLLDSLVPMNRKAQLWDLFVEHYADVAADAREDFHAAFGKAFLRAYNEQVRRLRAADRRG